MVILIYFCWSVGITPHCYIRIKNTVFIFNFPNQCLIILFLGTHSCGVFQFFNTPETHQQHLHQHWLREEKVYWLILISLTRDTVGHHQHITKIYLFVCLFVWSFIDSFILSFIQSDTHLDKITKIFLEAYIKFSINCSILKKNLCLL